MHVLLRPSMPLHIREISCNASLPGCFPTTNGSSHGEGKLHGNRDLWRFPYGGGNANKRADSGETRYVQY